MGAFTTSDGVTLAHHGSPGPAPGSGPLVCLPGGPMQASSYLGGLPLDGVVRLDLRGTGESGPAGTYRADRQVGDVEALRRHLGLDRLRLFGHSAGGTLAILYAIRFPERVEELVLVAPSPRVVGIDVTDDDRREVAERRHAEPWFEQAYAAFRRIWAGDPTPEAFQAIAPFMHGRWDDRARRLDEHPRNDEAAKEFYAEGAFDPEQVRARLATLDVPTLLVTGELDVALPPRCAREYADLFPRARLVVQQAAGHFPWLDDPESFAATLQRIP
ncbi:Pimeloyl-ACP methyl ester carboxylesterase [Lentzea xinjiangensis]|uniref:Pimeloyl-ACP methyl ester carboxylesterase n=1 Tax=Lentzea xinjiangensis TaxID=402600 RepID=A0A1H9P8I9_9PSEU|nr:alpha/beta hydrolase [Lentzea xinjiangensis]SER44099.1 Pimeloyl-ACP methyl ester carboxylesterase [Lentzea xinjiangensis]